MAYGIVQHVAGAPATSYTITATTAGNALAIVGWWSDSLGTTPTFSDGTNTYIATQTKFTSAANVSGNAWYAKNISSGITTITVTWSAGTPGGGQFWVTEISGLDTSAPLVGHTGQEQTAPGTGTGAVTSGTAAITGAPAIILGYCADVQSGTITPSAGFTQLSQTGNGTLMHQRQTVTGSYAVSGTTNFGTDNHASMMIALKEPAGATVTKVQSATASVSSFATGSVALTGVTQGNFLTLVVSGEAATTTPGATGLATPIDSAGNTWFLALAPGSIVGSGTGGSVCTGIAFCRNAAAGTHTLTVSLLAGWAFANGYMTLTEWNGLGQGASPDVANSNNATTAQSNTTTTATTASSTELVLAGVSVISTPGVNGIAMTDPPAGFTSLNTHGNTIADIGLEHSYLVTSTTGTQSAAWSWTDAGTAASQGVVVAFTGQGSATNVYYRPGAQFVDESVIQL